MSVYPGMHACETVREYVRTAPQRCALRPSGQKFVGSTSFGDGVTIACRGPIVMSWAS